MELTMIAIVMIWALLFGPTYAYGDAHTINAGIDIPGTHCGIEFRGDPGIFCNVD